MVDISSVPGSVMIVGESATILEEAVRKVGKDQKMDLGPDYFPPIFFFSS